MSHNIDRHTTKLLLTRRMAGDPSVKKAAERMADSIAALFVLCLEERLLKLGNKEVTVDDVVEMLKKEKGFETYVDAFKKGAEEEDEESEKEVTTKKKRETGRKCKKK